MFWKKREKQHFPKELLENKEYHVVNPEDIDQLNDINVKFAGTLVEKPIVTFYSAGWPWSIESRVIEEDHGHGTILKVNKITVYFKGPLYLRRKEKVTVWGKLKDGAVQAKRVEGEDAVYQS